MIVAVKTWFMALSRREQILVGILGALLALTILVFGIVQPLIDGYAGARSDHRTALTESARLSAKLDMLEKGGAGSQRQVAGSLHQVLAESAAERGFVVDSNTPRGNDAATITMASAGPAAFFAWVNDLEAQGIRLESLTTTPASNGAISVNASFASGAP